MDIVIRTGFEKITHKIKFNPSTEPKGKRLVLADHVKFVTEYRRDVVSYLIEAQVMRQATVGASAYDAALTVSIHLCSI